jgi:hypothetical protein
VHHGQFHSAERDSQRAINETLPIFDYWRRFTGDAVVRGIRELDPSGTIGMGKLAGPNMTGANEPYSHTPMFYADLFDLGYEAVSEISRKPGRPFQKRRNLLSEERTCTRRLVAEQMKSGE